MRKIDRIDLNNRTKNAFSTKKTNLNNWLISWKSKEEIKNLQKWYDLQWVKEKLEEMQDYNWNLICCYCETKKTNSPFEIEHIKPKWVSWYEQFCFDWDNLLYSCKSCNWTYKIDKYEVWFLNPSDTNYIFDKHFDFNEECFYITKTDEARINEKILKINERGKHPFQMRQELKRELVSKFEDYKSDNLSVGTIKKYIKRDFLLRWEMPSFWNFILEKIIASI